MATTVRRAVLTLPAAPLGPENPLPALRTLDEPQADGRAKNALPHTLLPVRILDGYGRERRSTDLDAVVIENERLRVTVLPGLGGRIHSLHHKPTGRELVYRNPVFQPANLALNGAWFSGGIEWNPGPGGHSTLSCAPLHTALVPAPDGGTMLRLWEWERLRDLPFQVDLWLPDDSDFLQVGVRIRNPHERAVHVDWSSRTTVEEDAHTRVLAPAEEARRLGDPRGARRVPPGEEFSAEYSYDVPDGARKWVASLDATGEGLVQTSTGPLRGRALHRWGTGTGGRNWQRWITEPGAPGCMEIRAGLAHTRPGRVRLDGGGELSWLEAYGPLAADPAAVHGDDGGAARTEVADRLEAALPRAELDAAYEAWLPYADADPGERLAEGSGWGALEVLCAGFKLPGTPFEEATLGDEQTPWVELLTGGVLPELSPDAPPGPTLVAPHWRDMLETAPAEPLTEYHLGIAQWHAGDLAQAVRSWERGLRSATSRWPLLRCLAVADQQGGNPGRAADHFAEAFDDLCRGSGDRGPAWTATAAALGREAIAALLEADRIAEARSVLDRLPHGVRERGAFRFAEAQLLLAEGQKEAARALFDAGFEIADLRPGDETLSEVWAALTDDPLPDAYDYRLRQGS
ncbi:DUF5107 domain-containing protein [Streptomyces sp. NPDC088725]|uniref:DUF5107 domain-containing protein n=1 Tax=Streptomyces sp. NPDC088725 TaxID=3365873 RepID=UPI003822CDC0